MAYGFGTTVNPQLGAVDYSNYLRGALSGAQMQAQGGAAIGAGVQNALAGIGEGIQSFEKRQKENSILAGQIGAMAQQAGVGEFLDEKNKKLLEQFIDPEKELNNKNLSQLMASLSVASAQNQKNQENAQKAREFQQENAQNAREFQLKVAELGAKMNNLAARTGLANAQTTALGRPKVLEGRLMPLEEFKAMQAEGLKVDGMLRPDGQVLVTGLGTYSSTPGVVVNTGEDAAAKVAATNIITDRDKRALAILDSAESAYPGIQQLTRGIEIIDNLDPNMGVFQPITQLKDKVLSAFGSKDAMERASATELLNAMQGSQVFELFSEIGLGARGLDTPAERDFMLDVLSGRVTMTPQSIRSLLIELRNRKVSLVKKYNNKVENNKEYREWVSDRTFDEVPVFDISFLDKKGETNQDKAGTDLGGGFTLN